MIKENINDIKRELDERNRQMLSLEYWVAIPSIIAAIVIEVLASTLAMNTWLRISLIAFGLVLIFAVAFVALWIEQKVGYYECKHCGHRYVPSYKQVCFAMHNGRTRYMKCPKCGKRSWQKKVLTKED